jgi:drug/metabolite transporter (DMT)-like permease
MDSTLALGRSKASGHATLLSVVVVWASAFSVIKVLLDEPLTAWLAVGGVLALGGVAAQRAR